MTSNLSNDLTTLGDDLDRAITAQVRGTVRLRRARRLGKRSTIAGALAAAVVAVGGVAAAATLLGPADVADGNVAGGCRSQDAEGAVWWCYAGERAVEEGLISAGFLGEQLQGPGRG